MTANVHLFETANFVKKIRHNVARAAASGRPHTEHMELGPPDAAYLLTLSAGNRQLKLDRVRLYLEQIHSRRFVDTGQGLTITSTGVLGNGHHRLTALSRAAPGNIVRIAITFGVPPEHIRYIDHDMGVRNERDRRAFERKASRSHKEVAIAKAYLILAKGQYDAQNVELLDRALDEELVEQFERFHYKTQWPASVWAPLFWAYPINRSGVFEFGEGILTSANHAPGAPAAHMRDFLLQLSSAGNAGGRVVKTIQARTLYLLRVHLQGRTLQKVYVPELKESIAWFAERLNASRSGEL